jgi:hypothetical protein
MSDLVATLHRAHQQDRSEKAWQGFDSIYMIITGFRAQLEAGTLQIKKDRSFPYYVYPTPTGELVTTAWEYHAPFVLGMIQLATGMHVTWAGPGTPIELHASPATIPASAMHVSMMLCSATRSMDAKRSTPAQNTSVKMTVTQASSSVMVPAESETDGAESEMSDADAGNEAEDEAVPAKKIVKTVVTETTTTEHQCGHGTMRANNLSSD